MKWSIPKPAYRGACTGMQISCVLNVGTHVQFASNDNKILRNTGKEKFYNLILTVKNKISGSYIVQESLRDSALSKKWKACPVKACKILEVHGQVIMYAEVNAKSDLEIKHSSLYAGYS